jgi:hypothetical protein
MLIRVGSRRIARTRSLGAYLSSTEQTAKAAYIQNSSADLIASGSIIGDSLTPELNIGDKSIVSSDFVSGLSGWRIAGTGQAEFQSVDVRGNITAESGQIGNWNISGAASSRVFGTSTLLGTYIESSTDIGSNDLDIVSGSYVGLFKSFIPDSINIVTADRTTNIVTLTADGDHSYQVGDQLIVTMLSGAYDATMNNGGDPVTITARTSTTLSYSNTGSTVASGAAVGSVIKYVEDVAGLYLRDYGKREFDYGYFSNKGVAYHSADILNLVHNSSFEWTYDYYDPGGGGFLFVEFNQPSLADWTGAAAGATFASYDFDGSRFLSSSAYGANLRWTTGALSTYVDGTISYLAADQFHLLSEDRSLGLGFDMFFDFTPVQKLVTTNPTATSTLISITTTTSHSFSIGDLVYIDFNVYNTNVDTAEGMTDYPIISYGQDGSGVFNNVFKVVSIPSGTVFTITNTTGTAFSGTTTRVAATNNDGTSRTQAAYKVSFPAFDLSEIRFKFSNNTTVSLSSVLSAASLAILNTTDGKYNYSSPSFYMDEYLNNNQTMRPFFRYSPNNMNVRGSLLEAAYIANDPTGYAAKSAIKVQFPGWLYRQTTDTLAGGNYNFTSTNKLTDSTGLGVGYVLDSVYLSTNNKPFYKTLYNPATSTKYEYNGSSTGLASDGSTYGLPTYPSIKTGLTWMDINLDSQEFTIQNVDELRLSAPGITKDLASSPSILPYNLADNSDTSIKTFVPSLYPETFDIVYGGSAGFNSGLGSTWQASTYSGGIYSYYDANSGYDIEIQAATLYHVGDQGSSSRMRSYRDYTGSAGGLGVEVESSVITETWNKLYGYKTVSIIQSSVLDMTGNIFGSLEPEAKVSSIEVKTSGLTLATLASSITMKADSILVNDSGTLTTGITAATGWTLGAYTYRRNSNMVQASITVTKVSPAITVDGTGNFTDSTIATMPAGFRPSFNGGTLSTAGSNGPIMTGYVTTAGAVVITATSDNATISVGQVLNISVIYMVA